MSGRDTPLGGPFTWAEEARIREIVREEIANSPAIKRSEGAREAFKDAAMAWTHGQPSSTARDEDGCIKEPTNG